MNNSKKCNCNYNKHYNDRIKNMNYQKYFQRNMQAVVGRTGYNFVFYKL